MYDAFISFSFKDLELAEFIVNTLINKHHIKAWMCTHDIQGGRRYKKMIVDAINNSKAFVLLQTKSSVASEQVPREVAIALNYGKTVIPFVIDDSELTGDLLYDLIGVHKVDAQQPPMEERIDALANTIREEIGNDPDAAAQGQMAEEEIPALNSRETVGNRYFAGRDDILQQIEQIFSQGHRIVFLRGMGGIGKSEIAIQYARKNRAYYKTVVFARYEKSLAETLADDEMFCIDGFSRRIKANGEQQTDEEYAQDKLNYISAHCGEDTLIILDNYDVDTDPFFASLIARGSFRLLVTTRYDQPEHRGHTVLRVGEIRDDAALKRIFIGNANPEYTDFTEDDPAFAELFAMTDRHTLALELIAQMAEELGCVSVGDVVAELKKQGLTALKGVYGAYDIIAKLVRNMTLSKEEKTLLMILQLMPEGGIDRAHFKKWCPEEVYKSHVRLLKRSTVKFDPQTGLLSLHPIVRDVLLREIPPVFADCGEFLRRFTAELVDYLSWNYSVDEKRTCTNCCRSILRYYDTVTKETLGLYLSIGSYYRYAIPAAERDVFFAELKNSVLQLCGRDSFEYAIAVYYEAYSIKMALDYTGARTYLEEAFRAIKEHIQDEIPGITGCDAFVRCCCDLAGLYADRYGKTGEASLLSLADERLAQARDALRLFPDKNGVLYGVRSGLISYMTARRKIAEGRQNTEEALSLLEEASRSYYPEAYMDQAMIRFRTAVVLFEKEDYRSALDDAEQSLQGYLYGQELCDVVSLTGHRICELYLLRAKCLIRLNEKKALPAIRDVLAAIDKVFERQSPHFRSFLEDVYRELAALIENRWAVSAKALPLDYEQLLSLAEELCAAADADASAVRAVLDKYVQTP